MCYLLFFSSRRRHTIFDCDWSSDVCSSDLPLSSRASVGTAEIPLSAACEDGYRWRKSRWLSRSSSSTATRWRGSCGALRSEEHTSELQSQSNLVCRLLLEKKKKYTPRRRRSLTRILRHLESPRQMLHSSLSRGDRYSPFSRLCANSVDVFEATGYGLDVSR